MVLNQPGYDRRWEVAIVVRKLLLSIITKYSVAGGTDTPGSVRQTLCNLGVMLVACTAHVYAKPFAHSDAVKETAIRFDPQFCLIASGSALLTANRGCF